MVRGQLLLFEHLGGGGLIADDARQLHADQVFVGRAGMDRHPAPHRNLHHAGHRQRRRLAADVGGQLALERHRADGGAIDRLNPQVRNAVVAPHDVEVDVGRDVAEDVGVFLEVASGAAGDAAAVHRRPAPRPFHPIADLDHLGHLRPTDVGLGHDFEVRAAGDLPHAVGEPVHRGEMRVPRPRLARQRQRPAGPDAERLGLQHREEHHAGHQQRGRAAMEPQRPGVEHLAQFDVACAGGRLAAGPLQHFRQLGFGRMVPRPGSVRERLPLSQWARAARPAAPPSRGCRPVAGSGAPAAWPRCRR